jgi:hypothetical protein
MGRTALLLTMVAMAAAGTLVPAAGQAQCRLCDKPSIGAERPLREKIRLEVETSLDFDRLILLGSGEGTASLMPDGSRAVSGMIRAISGRAMVGSAVVRGDPGRGVRIMLPPRIAMHSRSGASLVIEGITSDLPAAPRLDSRGVLAFRFGGRLVVSGDAEGDYRGDVPITVEYQ